MTTWLKDIKVLAWDLDGTLYPPTEELNQAIEQALVEALAAALDCSMAAAAKHYTLQKTKLKSSTKVLNQAGINGHQFFTDLWTNLPLEQFIQPNPDLERLFSTSKNLTHALHTNSNTLEIVKRKLACVGLSINHFTHIMTFPRDGYQKPDLQAFQMLVDELDETPEKILYIGDRNEVDLEPAKQLGLHTALISYSQQKSGSFQPDLVFNTPNEVLKYFL
jgi:putative hydrolase of the HAD superfamily